MHLLGPKETERHVSVLSAEHFSVSTLKGKRVSNSQRLAVKDHCLFFNHMVPFIDSFQF